jgi:hypothetical protein
MSATAIELPRTGSVAEPEHAQDVQQAGAIAPVSTESAPDQAAMILTPDQRVRVFISSTLQELAEERAAARRAVQRLHLAPVWHRDAACVADPTGRVRRDGAARRYGDLRVHRH